eukprot:300046_1
MALFVNRHFPQQLSYRYFCSTKQQSKYQNTIKSYVPHSIQPVLLNWYLAFLLKGSIETGIFEAIPQTTDSISIDSICKQCNTSPDITYKIMRFMSSMGYTQETKNGYFSHNHNSLTLCKTGNAYHTINNFIDADIFCGKLKFDEYLKGNTFSQLNNEQSILEFLNNDSQKRQNLSGMLMEFAMASKEPELIENKHFNFAAYNKPLKVIDIGGGNGELMFHLINKNENIKGIVFEQESYVENAKQYWLNVFGINMDNMENMEFVIGDFFCKDDIIKYCQDCDVIIMKRVIHDFDDEKCGNILNNIREAMNDNNNNKKVLLICDLVLSDELNDMSDIGAKLIDLEMGYLLNWKERRLSQFDVLLNKYGFKRMNGYPKELGNIHIIAVTVE